MNGAILNSIVMAIFFLLALVGIMLLQHVASPSPELARLSGQAILIAEHRGTVGDYITTYPPLPLLLSLPWGGFASSGFTPAALATAMLFSVLGVTLHGALRKQDVAWPVAFLAALLIMINPIILYAFANGPAAMLLLLGMLLLGFGLFGLRGGDMSVTDAMMSAFGLLLLALAHPFGLFLVLASLPGLALAAPPGLIARNPASLFLILLFPAIFGLLSFVYVRWVFGAEPFAFLTAALGPTPEDAHIEPVRLPGFLADLLLPLMLGTPLIAGFLLWNRKYAPRILPIFALLVTLMGAAILQRLLSGFVQPSLILALLIPILGVCAVKAVNERPALVMLMLMAGIPGTAVWLGIPAFIQSEQLPSIAYLERAKPRADQELAKALCGKKGVLLDTDAYAELVEICGTSKGLVVASEADFALQVQSQRLTSPYILAAGPGKRVDRDRIANTFPNLYDHGPPGYSLIFDEAGWRIYGRISEPPVS